MRARQSPFAGVLVADGQTAARSQMRPADD